MSQPSRILVIDDNMLFAQTVQRMLTRKGVIAEAAFDGPTGMAMAWENAYDLVIVDLVMPKLDGFEIIRRLKEVPKGPRLIAMSGNVSVSGPISLEAAVACGAHAVLEKPFTQDLLFERVFKTLAVVPRLPVPPRLDPSPTRARLFA